VPIAILIALSTWINRPVPVWNGRLLPPREVKGGVETCNLAVVRARNGVAVRIGPDRAFKKTSELAHGATVYVCNDATDRKLGLDRKWIGVAFHGRSKPCLGVAKLGLPLVRSRQCKTGWVEEKGVETLTG
jgi:hypothetical protein